MKIILSIIALFLSIVACKNDYSELNSEQKEISLLRADFEKQTGYDQSKEYLLTPAFRTSMDTFSFRRNPNSSVAVDRDQLYLSSLLSYFLLSCFQIEAVAEKVAAV